MAGWLSVALAVCLVGPAEGGRSRPEFADPEASAHFDAALAAFGERDFAAASEALRLAYEREAVAELLYARAQAERRLDHYDTAATLYAQYLATEPPRQQADNARPPLLFCRAKAAQEQQGCAAAQPMLQSYLEVYPNGSDAEQARAALQHCEAQAVAEAAADDVVPVDEVADPQPSPTNSGAVRPDIDDPIASRPWYRDRPGAALVGSGLGVAAIGTAVALAGRGVFVAAQDARGHDASLSQMDQGIVLERVGIGIAATGAAVTLAGVVRWIVVGVRSGPGRRAHRRRASSTAWATYRW